MWFLGAVLGGIAGAAAGRFETFFAMALVGAIAGAIAGTRGRRLDELDKRMSRMEGWIGELKLGENRDKVADLERRMAALEASAGVQETPVEPAPASASGEVAVAATASVEPVASVSVPEAELEAQALASQPAPVEEVTAEAAAQPAAPEGPTLIQKLLSGNLFAKAGVVILFFGIAFLFKYAYERVHVPIELRLFGVAVGALVMLGLGWRLRLSKPAYALALQGGGIGVLYLVVFGAFRLFNLLPPTLAFTLLVGIAVASAVLAVAQNSLTLAVTGVSGGFLAPILASTGQGSHVMLFSYYAVLNAGIVFVAWMKAWRFLNILGFAFTFIISWAWGAFKYSPEQFASTEPFLILFFLMYVAIPILFARQRAVELKDYVDGTLVFGVPLVAFGLQCGLVKPYEYGAAYSALALAVFYLVLASALIRRTGSGLRLLAESYLAIAVAFGTLAIPLAFEGRLTSAAWALEGAAVAWIGIRQGRLLARSFGYVLQFASGVAFLVDVGAGYGSTPVLNSFWLGCCFIAVGGFFCALMIARYRDTLTATEAALSKLLIGWAALWWYGGGAHEIVRHVEPLYRGQALLLFAVGSSIAWSLLSRMLRWADLRALWPVMYAAIALQLWVDLALRSHPFVRLGALAWGLAFATHFWLLARHALDQPKLVSGLHTAGLLLLAVVGAQEAGWQIGQAVGGARVWSSISWALVPAVLLWAVSSRALRARWPVAGFEREYVVRGAAPLAVFLALWTVFVNFTSNGNPDPLPYFPALNPLDIAIAVAFVLVARWLVAAREAGLEAWWQEGRNAVYAIFAALVFLWVNGMLLRTLHHWADLPFALEPMLRSRLVQASFSILWTLLALGSMVVATRRALRPVWVAGAVLMAVVVGKLFLVDLSGTGTVERIVSFLVVGVLLLVIGYFSPFPPASKEVEKP